MRFGELKVKSLFQVSPGTEVESDRYLIQIENVQTPSSHVMQPTTCGSVIQKTQGQATSTISTASKPQERSTSCKSQAPRVGLKRKQMVSICENCEFCYVFMIFLVEFIYM